MKIRKVVSTILIAAMLFFAPSMVPLRAGVSFPVTCLTPGLGWLPADTAFAIIAPCPPAPPTHGFVPAWFWAAFACPASIIAAGWVANFLDNRQLTYVEAWTCGLAYWFARSRTQQKLH